jgi:site-specific recombinase XerD
MGKPASGGVVMKKLKDERLFRLLRNFLTIYLPEQRSCSTHTIKSYRESINLLFSFLEAEKGLSLFDITFETINAQVILEFLSWLEHERRCGIRTRNQRLAAIRAFFNYAGKMDISLIEYQNNLRKIPMKKTDNSMAVSFLSESALATVLSEPDINTSKGIRDMFYMILLYDSGARNSELLNLRLKNVDLTPSHGNISVIGKGNKHRIIPIMNRTTEHCRKYLALYHENECDKEQYLFYIMRNGRKYRMSDDNVARFLKGYGISAKRKCPEIPDHLHPHLFRHTRAMHLYRGGMPLALLAQWLGHSQLETTLIYANADTEMKRQAIQKATCSANPVQLDYFSEREWKKDDDLIRELYGLK